MKAAKKPRPKSKRVKPCPNCEAQGVLAIQAINRKESHHKEQMEIALGTILEFISMGRTMRTVYLEIDRSATESDKALASYVQSFDSLRTELRAILETGRDDVRGTRWFAKEQVEKMLELIR